MTSRTIAVTVKRACRKGGSAVPAGCHWIGNSRSGLSSEIGQQRAGSRASPHLAPVMRHCAGVSTNCTLPAIRGLVHSTRYSSASPFSSSSSLAVAADNTAPRFPRLSQSGSGSQAVSVAGSAHGASAERWTREGRSGARAAELEVLHGQSRALWEPEMPREEAAEALGQFLGTPDLRPGEVVVMDSDDILKCLEAAAEDKRFAAALFSHACSVTERFFQKDVYYRGIVEFSNVCENDCYYCGIRKHKEGVHRYTIPKEEVVSVAMWAFSHKYGTLMLQAGQLNTAQRMTYLVDLITEIRRKTIASDLEQRRAKGVRTDRLEARELGLCVALSVGELSEENYRKLHEAGASRYLLRIESSNPELYASLHPGNQPFEKRLESLQAAKRVGLQIGTGVMIGLPGQTLRDLANDIVFFRQEEADMIGMGPYITEEGTPTAEAWRKVFGAVPDKKKHMLDMSELTTHMIALARITLGNVNIAATTALQAIDPVGREIALRRGANILMPILTPTKYRIDYQLYEGKPCITDTAEECRNCLNARVGLVGKRVKLGSWADPPHFVHPVVTKSTPPGTRAVHTLAGSLGWAKQKQDSRVWYAENLFRLDRRSLPGLQESCRLATSITEGDLGSASGALKKVSKSAGSSDLPRVNIGMFGSMNAGKSTLINLVTMQGTSIVDSTPGTTADTKIAFMELHGVGPVKLFDTAGIDEEGKLGEKKRQKSLNVLKECDLVLLVVDPLKGCEWNEGGRASMVKPEEMEWEKNLVQLAKQRNKDVVVVFNSKFKQSMSMGINEKSLNARIDSIRNELDPSGQFAWTTVDLSDARAREHVTHVLEKKIVELQGGKVLPSIPLKYLARDAMIFLNIPMDAETPGGRLLRPQAMVQEEVLRSFGTAVAYRMDLAAARGSDKQASESERARFLDALRTLQHHEGPKLLVTDSQAMDIVHLWTLDPSTGKPLIDITTFSIAMIQRQTGGKLPLLVKGLEAYKSLRPGDRVLVAEACNHNRITELCNDIATVQIPQQILKEYPRGGVILDHVFGREFPDLDGTDGLKQYKLAIHCGGCMVDRQKVLARITDLEEAGVPVTNFGLLLSYAAAPQALSRVLQPYNIEIPEKMAPVPHAV